LYPAIGLPFSQRLPSRQSHSSTRPVKVVAGHPDLDERRRFGDPLLTLRRHDFSPAKLKYRGQRILAQVRRNVFAHVQQQFWTRDCMELQQERFTKREKYRVGSPDSLPQ
jgi:hypothetical protein